MRREYIILRMIFLFSGRHDKWLNFSEIFIHRKRSRSESKVNHYHQRYEHEKYRHKSRESRVMGQDRQRQVENGSGID